MNRSKNKKFNVKGATGLPKVFLVLSMIIVIVISPVTVGFPSIDRTYTEQAHAKQYEQISRTSVRSENYSDNSKIHPVGMQKSSIL